MQQLEAVGQMRSECLYPIPLGGMMASGQIAKAMFARLMRGLLRKFSTQKSVDPQFSGLFEVTLPPTSTPGDSLNGYTALTNKGDLATQLQ